MEELDKIYKLTVVREAYHKILDELYDKGRTLILGEQYAEYDILKNKVHKLNELIDKIDNQLINFELK